MFKGKLASANFFPEAFLISNTILLAVFPLLAGAASADRVIDSSTRNLPGTEVESPWDDIVDARENLEVAEPGENELERELEFQLYLQWEKENEIKNLTRWKKPAFDKTAASAFGTRARFGADTLAFEEGAGVQVTRSRRLEWGVVAETEWRFESAESFVRRRFGASVGLTPLKGTSIVTRQFAEDEDDVKNLPRIDKIPYRASDIDRLRAGDQVSFRLKGGLVFQATAGVLMTNINALAVATGEWGVDVKKTSHCWAHVKVTHTRLQSYWLALEHAIAKVGAGEFASQDRQFSFVFDLRSPTARAAYEDLLKGNIWSSQTLKPAQGVAFKNLASRRSSTTGRSWYSGLEIPFLLELNWKQGQAVQKNFVSTSSGEKESTVHGIAFTFREMELPQIEQHYRKFFVANLNAKGILRDADFAWTFEGDDISAFTLRQALRELGYETGLREIIDVNVPEKNDVGDTEVEWRLKIPAAAIARAQQAVRASGLADALWTQVAALEPRTNHSCLEALGQNCQTNDDRLRGHNAIHRMIAVLRSLHSADTAASRARKLAAFGEAFGENQYSVQAGLRILGAGVKMSFEISGEELAHYEVEFAQTATGAWTPTEAPTGSRWDR